MFHFFNLLAHKHSHKIERQGGLLGTTLVCETGGREFEPHCLLTIFCHKIIIIWRGIFFIWGFNLKKAPWRPQGGLPWEDFCVSFWMWYKGMQKPHLSTEKLLVTLMNLKLWDFIPPNNTPRYPHETPGPFGILKGPKWMPLAKGCPKTKFWGAIWCTTGRAIAC